MLRVKGKPAEAYNVDIDTAIMFNVNAVMYS